MSGSGMSANLKLVFEHLNAVRELDRYLRRKGVDKDLERYIKEVFCPAVQERVPTLKTWHSDADAQGGNWYPSSWKLEGDRYLSLSVLLPGPLSPDDDNPSVNIFVPKEWAGRPAFSDRSTRCVKALLDAGFELAAEHDGKWDVEYPVAKYVHWLAHDRFDESSLVQRIALEVAKIVRLEPDISEAIGKASMKPKPKASKLQRGY